MLTFQIDPHGVWTGQAIELDNDAAVPAGWVIMATAPAPGLGEIAVYDPSGWRILPASSPFSAPGPAGPAARIKKIEFSRLFTDQQLVGYLSLKAQAKALTAADFADPAKAGLVSAAVMFEKFDMLPDQIELDHPETIKGVSQVLVGGGVITAPEAARILSNIPPPTV